MSYQIVQHHIILGQPHVPPEPGRLARLLRWFQERWGKANGNGQTNGNGNGHTNGVGHKNGTRSVGGTRHLHVCVNPEAPEEEQIVERFEWGIDIPLEQVLLETRALLDTRHAPHYVTDQKHVGVEL